MYKSLPGIVSVLVYSIGYLDVPTVSLLSEIYKVSESEKNIIQTEVKNLPQDI